MVDRRVFLTSLAGTTAALPFVRLPVMRADAIRRLARAEQIANARSGPTVAEDEAYWAEIRRALDLERSMVNLNNGGCSPAPTHVLEQMIRDLRFSNELPVEHMWSVLEPRIESVRPSRARRGDQSLEQRKIDPGAEADIAPIAVRRVEPRQDVLFRVCDAGRGGEAADQHAIGDGAGELENLRAAACDIELRHLARRAADATRDRGRSGD